MTTKPTDLTRVWGSSAPGGNVVDPDVTTPGKFAAGWLAEVPPFEHFNFLQQLFTQALAHNNEEGVNVWDTNTTYPVNALAKGSNGIVYIARVSQNGNDPTTDNGTNWLSYKIDAVDLRGFNTSSFVSAFQAAVTVATNLNLPLLIDEDYNVPSSIVISSLSGNLEIIGKGTLTFTGSATDYLLIISDTNGYDVEIGKDITFDGGSLVSTPIRINNPSASMADSAIGKVIFKGKSINAYMSVGSSVAASALTVVGGFSEVILENVIFRNVDREAGAGTPGSIGSAGFLGTFNDINSYIAKLTVIGGTIDTITSEDALGSGDDFDYDGINHSVPQASLFSNRHLPVSVNIEGVTFKNCRGRCVKTQVDGYTFVDKCTVIRDSVLPFTGAIDFDLQRGGGSVTNITEFIYPTSGNLSTFGNPHSIVAWSPDQLTTAPDNFDGGLRVKNIQVYNAIPTSLDILDYGVLIINDDPTKRMPGFSLDDLLVAGGRLGRAVRCTAASTVATELAVFKVRGVEANIVTSLINFSIGVGEQVRLHLKDNINLDSSLTPELVELFNDNEPLITGDSNEGFVENYLPQSTASSLGQMLRPGLICGPEGSTTYEHAMTVCHSLILDDDASGAFPACGSNGIAIITSNFAQTVQVIFSHTTSVLLNLGASTSDVTFGSTSNPDVDGDLNIWFSGGQINIKNRLGSNRTFHLTHIGG